MNPTPLHAWIADLIGCSAASFNRQQLEEYQWQALQANLKYCLENSPFYRALYHQITVPLISPADWASLPFTTAEDLRKDPNHFICVKQDDIQRIVTLPLHPGLSDAQVTRVVDAVTDVIATHRR